MTTPQDISTYRFQRCEKLLDIIAKHVRDPGNLYAMMSCYTSINNWFILGDISEHPGRIIIEDCMRRRNHICHHTLESFVPLWVKSPTADCSLYILIPDTEDTMLCSEAFANECRKNNLSYIFSSTVAHTQAQHHYIGIIQRV